MGLFDFLFPKKEQRSSNNFLDSFGIASSGVPVSEKGAMQLTAVWSAVNLISSTIASLPLNVYTRDNRGSKQIAYNSPLQNLLHNIPSENYTSYQFRNTMVCHLLLYGNAYAIIERNGGGRPVSFKIVEPEYVEVTVGADGKSYYTIQNEDKVYQSKEMLHFVGLSYDGVKGKSPISACREALGVGLATQKFGAKFFENGAILSGVLQTDGKLTEESAQRLRTSWNNRFGGVYKSHSTAVLEGGVNYKPISVPLVDAEFVKNRSFTIAEIARIFRVQPHMIMDLERSTNNNIEQQSIEFVTYTLMPYLVNIEQEFNRKIFSPNEQKNSYVKFMVSGLLRADVDSRGDYYRRLFEIGVLSANEIREFEDLNRVEGLDEHYVPLNLGEAGKNNTETNG